MAGEWGPLEKKMLEGIPGYEIIALQHKLMTQLHGAELAIALSALAHTVGELFKRVPEGKQGQVLDCFERITIEAVLTRRRTGA